VSGTRRGDDSSGDAEPQSRAAAGWPRLPGRLYLLRPEHLAVLAELDRLFPSRAPFVDFANIAPGAESVETVSTQLYRALEAGFEQPLFLAFCNINAERLLDAIGAILDRGAYPLARDEVLADLYVRVYEHLRGARHTRRSSLTGSFRWREPRGRWTLYHMLVAAAEALVQEQIEVLAACELPLPGLKVPELNPGEQSLERAHALLHSRGVRLPGKTVRHWVAHALVHAPEEERRLIYLREKRALSIEEISREIGTTPFETASRLKRAMLNLEERILRTALAFRADAGAPAGTEPEAAPDSSQKPGKLLTLRPRRESGARPPASEEEDPHESELDTDS
jgi:DNA-directed RNA polymerase specialized sigma24 family protein